MVAASASTELPNGREPSQALVVCQPWIKYKFTYNLKVPSPGRPTCFELEYCPQCLIAPMATVDLSRQRKLGKIAEKLEKLQFERAELDYKIIQTRAEYGALYNKTSPVLNLPIEIICRMFELAHDASLIEGIPDNPLIEITISHVCRQRRAIALSS